MNTRSASLKRRDFIAIGFTPGVRLENKVAFVSATANAHLESLDTIKSGESPLN